MVTMSQKEFQRVKVIRMFFRGIERTRKNMIYREGFIAICSTFRAAAALLVWGRGFAPSKPSAVRQTACGHSNFGFALGCPIPRKKCAKSCAPVAVLGFFCRAQLGKGRSTRLNSSHLGI